MDDALKKASQGVKVTYDQSFWDEAKAKLDDANLDDAFRLAANLSAGTASFEPTNNVDDVFMDAAFVEASSDVNVTYNSSFFEEFKQNEAQFEMDAAYQAAAASVVVDYTPEYWSDADVALQKEGLHYEYQTAYWDEAKKLLDKADRTAFFTRWTSAAAVLMLLSFFAPNLFTADRGLAGVVENKGDFTSRFETQEMNENSLLLANNHAENALSDTEISNELNVINESNASQTNEASETTNGQSVNVSTNTTTNTSMSFEPLLSSEEVTLSPLPKVDIDIHPTILEERSDIALIDLKEKEERLIPELELNPNNHKPQAVHSIALLAAGGIGNRWASPQLVPTLRSSFGAEYLYSPAGPLKNVEFGMSANINHTRQNGLGVEKRTSVYDINGGVTKYWYKLQISDIVTTNLNFITNYRIAPRHKFRLGCGVEWLTAVKSNMSYQSAHFGDIQTVNNNWGVKDGLNAFDFRVSAGYDFQLTNQLTIQLSGNVGFLDRTNNDFLKSNVYDREMNIMLGLKYNIFRKI